MNLHFNPHTDCPKLIKGQCSDCCLYNLVGVKDIIYDKEGIVFKICSKCHMAWRSFKGVKGLRSCGSATLKMIAETLGEESLNAIEKEYYEATKDIEQIRLKPME